MNWIERLKSFSNLACLNDRSVVSKYADLIEQIYRARDFIADAEISSGDVVFFRGDFSLRTMAAFFALVEAGCIVVPHSAGEREAVERKKLSWSEFDFDSISEKIVRISNPGTASSQRALIDSLKKAGDPGLILFSSGSGGEPKAVLHNLNHFFSRFQKVEPKPLRTAAFLLFDHIGGLNTFLMTMASGGELIVLGERTTESVFTVLRKTETQVLPCSPTFLRLALAALDKKKLALPALQLITYGTEVMPMAVLRQLGDCFPGVRFKQTYGLSELGILKTQTDDKASTFLRLGDEETKFRVINGLLEVRTRTSMLGYLNAPSPFTQDGWYKTGDRVEQSGDLIRFLGRDSDVINVGGLKVYPADVEEVLSEIPEVVDVIVAKESNALLGEVVVAHIRAASSVSLLEITAKVHDFCRNRLSKVQTPQKIVLHDEPLFNERFKRKNMTTGHE